MDHTQKMFLVPQHQIELLKQQQQQHQHEPQPSSIRRSVQNELDRAMTEVLEQPDTNVYEKAKKYASILQRYLAVVRQGEQEKTMLTLSLPSGESSDVSIPRFSTDEDDDTIGVDYDDDGLKKNQILGNVIKHMPKKSKKQAECILDALNSSNNIVSWTDKGEIIINNQVVRGTHLYDLVKSVTASHNVLDHSRPTGWKVFLKTLANLNVLLSAIPNTQVRNAIAKNKMFVDDNLGTFTPSVTTQSLHSTPLKEPKAKKAKGHRPNGSWMSF